jgi:hypothetical protein
MGDDKWHSHTHVRDPRQQCVWVLTAYNKIPTAQSRGWRTMRDTSQREFNTWGKFHQFPKITLHKRKEAPDLSGTKGRGRKSKVQELNVCLCSGTTSDDSATMVVSYGMNKIKWLIKQTTSITNVPWKYKHHPLMKVIDIPDQDCSLTILEMNFRKCDNFYKPADFYFSEWSTGSCVDEPQCNS